MPGYALIDALPDFGAPRRAERRAAEDARSPQATQAPVLEPEVEKFTREELEKAVADARAEAEERLSAAHELEMLALAQENEAAIERIHRELGEQAGASIAGRLSGLEARLTESTTAVVARILGVALSEQVTRDAVDQLAGTIRAALADREVVRLRVQGPLSLLEALRPALGAYAERAEFVETQGLDVSVALDSSLFETRIADWSAALSEALAGARA